MSREFMMKGTRFRGALLNACIGAMIFILLGSVWAVFGLWSLRGKGVLIIAVLLGLCLLLLLMIGIDTIRKVLRLPPDDLSMEMRERIARTKRWFGIVNVLQGIAIGAT